MVQSFVLLSWVIRLPSTARSRLANPALLFKRSPRFSARVTAAYCWHDNINKSIDTPTAGALVEMVQFANVSAQASRARGVAWTATNVVPAGGALWSLLLRLLRRDDITDDNRILDPWGTGSEKLIKNASCSKSHINRPN